MTSPTLLVLLLGQVHYWAPLLNSSIHLLYSSAAEFVRFYFIVPTSLSIFLLCSCIICLVLFSCLCYANHWAALKLFLILCQIIHRSPFLWSWLLEIYFVPFIGPRFSLCALFFLFVFSEFHAFEKLASPSFFTDCFTEGKTFTSQSV